MQQNLSIFKKINILFHYVYTDKIVIKKMVLLIQLEKHFIACEIQLFIISYINVLIYNLLFACLRNPDITTIEISVTSTLDHFTFYLQNFLLG